MSWPYRTKSFKNLFSDHQTHHKQLRLQHLNTEPNVKTSIINCYQLVHKNNVKQKRSLINKLLYQKVQNMRKKYYDHSYIYLQNEIQFSQQEECLKRYYFDKQYQKKIQYFTEYYKFHQEQPRLFMTQTYEIIECFQEQKRNLEYQKVKNKMEEDHQKQQMQNVNQELVSQNYLKTVKIQNNKYNQGNQNKKHKKVQKMLKNIHLSYIDFEKKPQKQNKRPTSKSVKSKQKTIKSKLSLVKSNSVSSKILVSKDIELIKKQIKSKKYSLETGEHKQLKKLQSKYKEVISELFKKKRSSSRNSVLTTKFQYKQDSLKCKQESIKCKQEFVQDKNQKQVQNEQKDQTKILQNSIQKQQKIIRSKSQVNILSGNNIQSSKSSKLLSTFKQTLRKEFKQWVQKPKQQQKQTQNKRQILSNEQTMKKYSSSKSINIDYQGKKTVKTFQITKKDLILNSLQSKKTIDKKPLLENKQIQNKKSSLSKLKQNKANSKGKQNINNSKQKQICEKDNRKRSTSQKPLSILQFKCFQNKIKAENQKIIKQTNKIDMFSRVLKSKMRA